MASYARVRTDNMSGTDVSKDLVSLKYKASGAFAAIENGNVVVVGDLLDGEREVREASTPASNTALSAIALVASEEVVKEKKYHTLADFRNEAGSIIRGYRLNHGDIFSVTKEALTGTAAKNSVVELQAGTKLKVVATATTSTTTVGKVIALEGDWIVIEVA